jgi:tetratricopeptide (TPR) repeat protein
LAEKDTSSRKEPSDLFKVEEATSSISPVDKIVLPPEEALKRRIRRLILAGIAAVIFFLIAHTVLGWITEARLESALDEVINDASPEVIDDALSMLRSEPNPSVRARLLATAGLGGDRDKLTQAEELMAEAADPNDPDQRIARIYAFLAEGDARAAHGEAERPAKYKDQADAFLRGRALTAIARGQAGQALADAKQVVEARPGAPEPAALLALIVANTDSSEEAIAVLDKVGRETSATTSARARILADEAGNDDEVVTLSDEILEDDESALVHQLWANYLKGLVAFRRGAVGDAYRYARAAAEPDVRADEALIVRNAQLLLALGRTEDAKVLLKRLTSGPSSDLFSRAHVIAWWYAQSGDSRAGFATLEGAGLGLEEPASNAFRALVLAELLKTSPRASDRKRAGELLDETTADPEWGVLASASLGELLLDDGETEKAIDVMKKGLAAHPNHLALVDATAQAMLSIGQVDEASAVTEQALKAFDGEGWAHGSHARVLLARGDSAKALSALDQAIELSPEDARLHALRGDAARDVGSVESAKTSYEKALQLNPAEARALSGYLALLIDIGDFPSAGEVMQQMDEAKVRDLRSDEQRLRYLVRTGAGQSGLVTMRNAVSRHSKNVPLRLAGARVALQAEDYSRAMSYYQIAKRDGADARMAQTALALAQLYGRRKLGAENSLERALEATDEEGNKLDASPEVQVWELIVKARLALADEMRGLAVRYAKQASAIRPDDVDLALLQADIEEDRERSPEEALRRAVAAEVPMPIASGRLGVLLGPTEEGCDLVASYLRANRGGKMARKARVVRDQCASE